MEFKQLGWEKYREAVKLERDFTENEVARVAIENRGGYLLYSVFGELIGIVQGKFMRSAVKESDYPKVGDWVLMEKLPSEQKAIIKEILPRITKVSRRRVAKDRSASDDKQEEQIIATNVDIVFIVQGLDGDFNVPRLERYITMTKEGGCRPIVLLNKCDAVTDGEEKMQQLRLSQESVEAFLVSAVSGYGIDQLRKFIEPGTSVVFVGSSGVGKSTLLNALVGIDLQKTQEVRIDDSRGRHTTTKRELFLLPQGGILIDTPGMRELALWATQDAVVETFQDMEQLAANCKFNDCDHTVSNGCAILAAIESGEVSEDRYQSFIKLHGNVSSGDGKSKKNAALEMRTLKKQMRKDVNRFTKKKK